MCYDSDGTNFDPDDPNNPEYGGHAWIDMPHDGFGSVDVYDYKCDENQNYDCTIDAPDNSVIIADSNQIHGVTQIEGKGQRFTCVAYCDNRLATKGVAGKSERKIGRFAAKESGSLEDFI